MCGDPLTRTQDGGRAQRGRPAMVCSYNGAEFTEKAKPIQANRHGIFLRLIEPGKPHKNAYVEPFNG
jgi:putative transposase